MIRTSNNSTLASLLERLSEKFCACAVNSLDKEACLRNISNDEDGLKSDEADAQCAALVKGCDCKTVNTAEGKIACGLAYPRPTPPPQ